MRADPKELRYELRSGIEALALSLLGEPNKAVSCKQTWRWGAKGSLALEVAGSKRGVWFSHEIGIGGDALDLIRHARGCSFVEAVEWARTWVGTPKPERPQARFLGRQKPVQDDKDKLAYARRLWVAGRPVAAGSVADLYLTATRGIPRPAAGWPAEAVRFHPSKRALMVAATTAAGSVQAVQLIYLDPHGRKAAIEIPKQSFGLVKGAAVRLPGKLPVLLAEGPETGLAAWSATQHAVMIALGSVTKLEPPAFAVLLAEDYPRHHQAEKALKRALRLWGIEGRDVVVCRPWSQRRFDKTDLADVILADGSDAVRARVRAALDPAGHELRSVPLPIASVRLDQAIGRFVKAAEAPGATSPFVQAIRIDLGGGKSSATRRELAGYIRRLRAAGDKRPVVVALPTHALATEAAQRMAELAPDLLVDTWRGRGAAAPYRLGKMCQEPDRVAVAREVRLDVVEFACNGCRFRPKCEYMAQHSRTADLWFVTNALLATRIPAAIGEPAMLVVDEMPKLGVTAVTLPLLDLGRHDVIDRDRIATERLRSLRLLVLDALAEAEDGPLTPDIFRVQSMTAESAAELHELEWRTLVKPEPGDQTRALREAARNADLGSRAMLALALKELLKPGRGSPSGIVSLRTREDGRRDLIFQALHRMHDTWRAAPTLVLDATLRLEVMRQTWPAVELIADVAIEAPHQRVRQIADGGFTLAALDMDAAGIADSEKLEPAERDRRKRERARRERNLRRLRVMLHTEARRYAGAAVLLVTNKAVAARLVTMGLPTNVEVANFGSIRGIDRWKDVRAVIVVGWTLPPAGAVERLAGALTGVAVPATGYVRGDATRLLADNTTMLSESWHHPDPLAEALRWSTCEAELLQAIGRGRGVQRTAVTPLDVLVMSEVLLPIPVELVPAAEPSLEEQQLAEGGVAYAAASHAWRAYGTRLYTSEVQQSKRSSGRVKLASRRGQTP